MPRYKAVFTVDFDVDTDREAEEREREIFAPTMSKLVHDLAGKWYTIRRDLKPEK